MNTTPCEDAAHFGTGTYFRELCEQVGVALVATDRNLNIRVWNGAAARMFGAGAERMIGTSILSIVPAERRRGAERMLRRAVKAGETSEFEFEHRDSQGEHRELAAVITAVATESGQKIGASMCVRDITRRIALQAELDESRKIASLGELAGAIAHHFNNVLGGIVTSIDYAIDAGDPALTQRVLEQTNRALVRATALVNGLLAFAEGGPRSGDLCDLTELVYELADEIERGIVGRGIDLTLNLPTLPVTPVPRTELLTVLRNITQNAIEAMPKGGKLTVEVETDARGVNIAVQDTGCGLDEVTRSRMFEPFWTTKGVLSAGTGRGIGLGLAIAHGLVQRLGGSINVRSEVNKGSSFQVFIPTSATK